MPKAIKKGFRLSSSVSSSRKVFFFITAKSFKNFSTKADLLNLIFKKICFVFYQEPKTKICGLWFVETGKFRAMSYLLLFSILVSGSIYAFVDISFNIFSSIYYFKTNESFNQSISYVHKGKEKVKWDIDGDGFYFSTSLNLIKWLKPSFFIGKASFIENLDSFNNYTSPKYKVSNFDWGLDLKIYPFLKILYIKLGLLKGYSNHSLLTPMNERVELFYFKGEGYEAGFGFDVAFEKGCFGYNCGIIIEYIARKAWAKDIKLKLNEIELDDSKKSSYRTMILAMGLFWYY